MSHLNPYCIVLHYIAGQALVPFQGINRSTRERRQLGREEGGGGEEGGGEGEVEEERRRGRIGARQQEGR